MTKNMSLFLKRSVSVCVLGLGFMVMEVPVWAVPAERNSTSSAKIVKKNGIRYLTLSEIVDSLKMNLHSQDKAKGDCVLMKSSVKVEIFAKKDYIIYNGSKIFFARNTIFEKGILWISYDDYKEVLVSLLAPSKPVKSGLKKIIIDAGHGGKDSGSENKTFKLKEKDLALKVASKVGDALKKSGYSVELSRSTDTFLELKDRSEKSKSADLFLSIHFNSAANSQAQGIEVLTYPRKSKKEKNSSRGNEFDAWNLVLGYTLENRICRLLDETDRGVKMQELGVLKGLYCPGVLVECGFLSNSTTAKKLQQESYLTKIADSIVQGVKDYDANLKKLK